jgi:hypothetical protein
MLILIGLAIVCGLMVFVFGLKNARTILRWMIAAIFAAVGVALWFAGDGSATPYNGWLVAIGWAFFGIAFLIIKIGDGSNA